MADDNSASIITLHQPQRAAKTPAERARAYRERKKAGVPVFENGPGPSLPVPVPTPVTLLPPEPVTSRYASRRHAAPVLLTASALTLAAVGVTINGWFARSLGGSDVAGWLFLAIGVAADALALAMPSCAASLWITGQRGTAVLGWGVWLLTFAFAVIASIGFASVNIADVTASRSSRVTPAVTAAQTALNDAMASRDRECRGGVGKFCRERETAVVDRRQALDVAMQSVGKDADPQTEAVIRVVSWASFGALRPSEHDFAMLRLILLAMLPQIGGVVLMIGRRQQ